jgi:hypothetical protein
MVFNVTFNNISVIYRRGQFIMVELHRWCNSLRARLECGRSWVRVPVESNQTIKLVFVASPLSTQH